MIDPSNTYATGVIRVDQTPTDPRLAISLRESRSRPAWLWFFPGCGCGLVFFSVVASLIALLVTGRGLDIARAAGVPVGTPARPKISATLDKVAKLDATGQRSTEGSSAVFDLNNRGFAAHVIYNDIPKGTSTRMAIVWERLEANGPVALRQPDFFTVTDLDSQTSWWYSMRRDSALPAGLYQFTLGIAGIGNEIEPLGSLQFEVKGR